ncbi:hypothetical protein EYV94_10720 [Puteibacter caeruleilacunae]|nr:hypothetical protein EYV94_10720 [Puteibacter caeruleilacunae]
MTTPKVIIIWNERGAVEKKVYFKDELRFCFTKMVYMFCTITFHIIISVATFGLTCIEDYEKE